MLPGKVRASSNGSFLWYGLNYDTSLSGDGSTSGYALDTTTCSSNGTCVAAPSSPVTQWIQLFIEKNTDFPVGNLTREEFDSLFHAGKQQFDDIISANDPDLTRFRAAGGKMLTYHGMVNQFEYLPPRA
jgi:feruloyl esterase